MKRLQWGHATRGVEDDVRAGGGEGGAGGFNGATPRGAWKTVEVDASMTVAELLQWGHATRGVEDRVERRYASRSSSLLQWGHATRGVEDSKPQSGKRPVAPLQWGHATR